MLATQGKAALASSNFMLKTLLPFSLASTIVLGTGPVRKPENLGLILPASASEATTVKNARESGMHVN